MSTRLIQIETTNVIFTLASSPTLLILHSYREQGSCCLIYIDNLGSSTNMKLYLAGLLSFHPLTLQSKSVCCWKAADAFDHNRANFKKPLEFPSSTSGVNQSGDRTKTLWATRLQMHAHGFMCIHTAMKTL